MFIRPMKGFTLIEIVLVIVVIGILGTIAIPRFAKAVILAKDSKASSQLAAVMSSLSTERQKRILRGDYTNITSLGDGKYAFSQFSPNKDNERSDVLDVYILNCNSGEKGCWKRVGRSYIYYFADRGDAKYKLEKNKIKCDDSTSDCARLLK